MISVVILIQLCFTYDLNCIWRLKIFSLCLNSHFLLSFVFKELLQAVEREGEQSKIEIVPCEALVGTVWQETSTWLRSKVEPHKDSTIVYSGMAREVSHNQHRGVDMLLSKKHRPCLRLNPENLSQIAHWVYVHYYSLCCYQWTCNEGNTEAFYHSLQSVVAQVPPQVMLLPVGDFNARVGNDAEAWNGTLGIRFAHRKLLTFALWMVLHWQWLYNSMFSLLPWTSERSSTGFGAAKL